MPDQCPNGDAGGVDTDNSKPKKADKNQEECLSGTQHDIGIDKQPKPIALFPTLNVGLFSCVGGSRGGNVPRIQFAIPWSQFRRRGHGAEPDRIDLALDRFEGWCEVCSAGQLDLMAGRAHASNQRHHRNDGALLDQRKSYGGHWTAIPALRPGRGRCLFHRHSKPVGTNPRSHTDDRLGLFISARCSRTTVAERLVEAGCGAFNRSLHRVFHRVAVIPYHVGFHG